VFKTSTGTEKWLFFKLSATKLTLKRKITFLKDNTTIQSQILNRILIRSKKLQIELKRKKSRPQQECYGSALTLCGFGSSFLRERDLAEPSFPRIGTAAQRTVLTALRYLSFLNAA
jgi:hypothetical protein